MNQSSIERMRAALQKAHKAIEEEFNTSISIGTITYYLQAGSLSFQLG